MAMNCKNKSHYDALLCFQMLFALIEQASLKDYERFPVLITQHTIKYSPYTASLNCVDARENYRLLQKWRWENEVGKLNIKYYNIFKQTWLPVPPPLFCGFNILGSSNFIDMFWSFSMLGYCKNLFFHSLNEHFCSFCKTSFLVPSSMVHHLIVIKNSGPIS